MRGARFNNPNGSVDDWHEQQTHYGIAFANIVVTCLATIAGIVLIFISPR